MSGAPLLLLASAVPRFLEAELAQRFEVRRLRELRDVEAWIAGEGARVRVAVTAANVGLDAILMQRLPSLELVAIFGVGFDGVDTAAAEARGIHVSYTPDVLNDDVADLALGLTLALLRDLPAADRHVRSGAWSAANLPLGRKATGRCFGIAGLGRIGKAIATRVAVLGSVAYTGRHPQPVPYRYFPSLLDLAGRCDVLILAASANAATRHMVDRAVLDALGARGYLINIARGALVDEPELIAALRERRIAGAALDVFADEPNVPDALRALPNVVLAPHIGSATEETRHDMAVRVLENVDAYLAGLALPHRVV